MNRNDFQGSQIKQLDLAPWAFLIFSLAGSVGVAVSKYYNLTLLEVVSIPVSVLILYVLCALFLPRLELRKDQIGDNTYYLGFLFTLISLTVTLIQYNSESDDDFIVSNFGVALASTVVGIFLRSLLSQMRKDIVGVEREMHASLRDASVRLRGQIAASTESFGSLQRHMAQITEESVDAISNSHKLLAKGLNDIVQEQAESLNKQVVQSNDAITQKTDHLCKELERTARALSESVKEEQVALVNTASAAKRSISSFENISIDTSALNSIEEAIKAFSGAISQKLNEVAKASSSDIEYLTKASKSISESAQLMESSIQARVEVANKQTSSMSEVVKRLEEVENSLVNRTEDLTLVEKQTNSIGLLVDKLSDLECRLTERVDGLPSLQFYGEQIVEQLNNIEQKVDSKLLLPDLDDSNLLSGKKEVSQNEFNIEEERVDNNLVNDALKESLNEESQELLSNNDQQLSLLPTQCSAVTGAKN